MERAAVFSTGTTSLTTALDQYLRSRGVQVLEQGGYQWSVRRRVDHLYLFVGNESAPGRSRLEVLRLARDSGASRICIVSNGVSTELASAASALTAAGTEVRVGLLGHVIPVPTFPLCSPWITKLNSLLRSRVRQEVKICVLGQHAPERFPAIFSDAVSASAYRLMRSNCRQVTLLGRDLEISTIDLLRNLVEATGKSVTFSSLGNVVVPHIATFEVALESVVDSVSSLDIAPAAILAAWRDVLTTSP